MASEFDDHRNGGPGRAWAQRRHRQAIRWPGATIWLTGLPGAGKTTVAEAIESVLIYQGRPVCVLDGDELRDTLSSDLGFSRADRAEQARRAGHVATLLSRSGIVAVVALVSPFAEDRQRAHDLHDAADLPFMEVWVDTPAEVCVRRDAKGLYARAGAGEIGGLTGFNAPYEQPIAPDFRVDSASPPDITAKQIVELLLLVDQQRCDTSAR